MRNSQAISQVRPVVFDRPLHERDSPMVHDLEKSGAGTGPGAIAPATQPPTSAPSPAADPPAARGRSLLGSALLFLGIGLLALLLIDPGELPLSMPRSWYIDRTLWVAGGLIAVGTGWHLLRDADGGRPGLGGTGAQKATLPAARLGIAGRRFSQLVLYTRTGCHLCDEARATLNKYGVYLPPIVEVDIDHDPALIGRFSTCVPVVELDGKVRFRGRVNEVLLRRLIAATPPRDTTGSGEDI
jgi:glutaredoxin